MPEKTVHWASSNEFYYASPNNSPTSSSSGSPGPMTPPPGLPGVASIHENLRFKRNLGFINDLLYDPTEGSLDSELLDELATIPPVAHLSVVSSALPFVLHIREPKEGMGITIGDLLRRLHLVLQEKATQDLERERPETRKAILEAFDKRCDKLMEHSVALASQEKDAGPRRIDYLQGRSVFAGFSVTSNDSDHLTLRLHVRFMHDTASGTDLGL
ncbi:hypothetical protein J3R30DRAFT_3406763 [Lentinula aciculospora]|uniref:DUF6699 domain-containing protein n=1 Tax=Lentinula aciculospora TaxID=153920 RepID=A0A9W9A2K6_9AGAR|nr:hypothetical protein J3R30DRAFT_3406763 [Lentinula aciculospora]